jgi:hypothetical protein
MSNTLIRLETTNGGCIFDGTLNQDLVVKRIVV